MRRLALLVTLLAVSLPVFAGPVNVTFISFGPSGQWQNGYPYWVYIQGNTYDTPVMCDDYVHAGNITWNWLANETNLGLQNVSGLRFGNQPNALTEYDEAGWLLLQTLNQGINQWKDMNYAVWNIFDTASPCDSGCQFWLAAAEEEAMKGFKGVPFGLVTVLTPHFDPLGNNPNGPQEFLFIGVPPNSILDPPGGDPPGGGAGGTIPEPASLLLLGTGLAALWRRARSC